MTRWDRGRRHPRARHLSGAAPWRVLAAVAVVTAVVGFPLAVGPSSTAGAAAAPPFTVSVTPTTNLADGDPIDITLTAAPGRFLGVTSLVYICRDDATYSTLADLAFRNGKCPGHPISSSGSAVLPWSLKSYPDGSGAVTRLHVGVGTTSFGPSDQPDKFSLTCDSTHPCRLVIDVVVGASDIIDSSTRLTFTDSSPLASCGGTEDGAPTTAGSDRILAAWTGLTRSYCTAKGKHQPTQAVLTGEGDGQKSFNDGSSDLVYSSYGNRFPGHDGEAKRDDVAVPMALNAAVIGVLGGFATNDPKWPAGVQKPYDDVKVTIPEMATAFGQGQFSFASSYSTALQDRNPQLRGFNVVNGTTSLMTAPAGGEASTWFATSSFFAVAPGQWKTAPQELDGNPPNQSRQADDSFAQASPPFAPSLFSLYSNRAGLQKLVAANEFLPNNYGPIWILTDLATATLYDIPTAAIQNSNGEFVKPTAASLTAAATTMTEQPDGTELPSIGHDAPGAYPLTFVEHAVAPHEPLLDESCAPRASSQALLADWLQYLTTDGQSRLSNGLVALPPDLLAKAQTKRAEVGTAAPTGACGPATPPDGPGDGPGGAPDGFDTGLPTGIPDNSFDASTGGADGSSVGGSSAAGAGGSAGGAAGAGAGGPAGTGPATEPIAQADNGLPGFGGGASGVIGGTLALLALAVVGGVGGYVSSQRGSNGPTGGQPS